jgi:hypothetical protein
MKWLLPAPNELDAAGATAPALYRLLDSQAPGRTLDELGSDDVIPNCLGIRTHRRQAQTKSPDTPAPGFRSARAAAGAVSLMLLPFDCGRGG